jgi:hypothetical protein
MDHDLCITCGADVSPGTRLFSDRYRVDEDRFECAACRRDGASQAGGPRHTDEQRELGLINSSSVGIWNN